ncbi:hypothetical protein MPSEU_000133000 [Mayamaea pseudoterrestris]|nr:hypothetical protein MPSEU_000133000 [Mayamaea pseudoterrestris]
MICPKALDIDYHAEAILTWREERELSGESLIVLLPRVDDDDDDDDDDFEILVLPPMTSSQAAMQAAEEQKQHDADAHNDMEDNLAMDDYDDDDRYENIFGDDEDEVDEHRYKHARESTMTTTEPFLYQNAETLDQGAIDESSRQTLGVAFDVTMLASDDSPNDTMTSAERELEKKPSIATSMMCEKTTLVSTNNATTAQEPLVKDQAVAAMIPKGTMKRKHSSTGTEFADTDTRYCSQETLQRLLFSLYHATKHRRLTNVPWNEGLRRQSRQSTIPKLPWSTPVKSRLALPMLASTTPSLATLAELEIMSYQQPSKKLKFDIYTPWTTCGGTFGCRMFSHDWTAKTTKHGQLSETAIVPYQPSPPQEEQQVSRPTIAKQPLPSQEMMLYAAQLALAIIAQQQQQQQQSEATTASRPLFDLGNLNQMPTGFNNEQHPSDWLSTQPQDQFMDATHSFIDENPFNESTSTPRESNKRKAEGGLFALNSNMVVQSESEEQYKLPSTKSDKNVTFSTEVVIASGGGTIRKQNTTLEIESQSELEKRAAKKAKKARKKERKEQRKRESKLSVDESHPPCFDKTENKPITSQVQLGVTADPPKLCPVKETVTFAPQPASTKDARDTETEILKKRILGRMNRKSQKKQVVGQSSVGYRPKMYSSSITATACHNKGVVSVSKHGSGSNPGPRPTPLAQGQNGDNRAARMYHSQTQLQHQPTNPDITPPPHQLKAPKQTPTFIDTRGWRGTTPSATASQFPAAAFAPSWAAVSATDDLLAVSTEQSDASTLPMRILCSESFLQTWSDLVAELGSGRWKALTTDQDQENNTPLPGLPVMGRPIELIDSPLVDKCGVDIELPNRQAIIVHSLSALDDETDAKQLVLEFARLVLEERYTLFHIIVCCDTIMTAALSRRLANLVVAGEGLNVEKISPFTTRVVMASPESISATIAATVSAAASDSASQGMSPPASLAGDAKIIAYAKMLLIAAPMFSASGAIQCVDLVNKLAPGVSMFPYVFESSSIQHELMKRSSEMSTNCHATEINPTALRQLVQLTRLRLPHKTV